MKKQTLKFLVATLVTVALAIPAITAALTVEGNYYPSTVTIEGTTLKLVGAGLREKWMFDVYTMGTYSQSGKCDAAALINDDEVKYLRINMLRDVSAEKMAEALNDAFKANMPSGASVELKGQVKTFLSYFVKECSKGTKIEMIYVPGKGTILKQNAMKLGPPMKGTAFSKLLWSCYFSPKTCCKDLKKQVIKSCK